jgi:hypothetical protein
MNGVGFGATCANWTITCDTPPLATVNITMSLVHPTNLTVTWTPLTTADQTGGDPISYYQVSWLDTTQSPSVWTILNTDLTLITSIVHVYPYGVFPSASVQSYVVQT